MSFNNLWDFFHDCIYGIAGHHLHCLPCPFATTSSHVVILIVFLLIVLILSVIVLSVTTVPRI